jgi:hypothetical protein
MAIIERILGWLAGPELVVVFGDDPGRDEMSGHGALFVGECAGESVVALGRWQTGAPS